MIHAVPEISHFPLCDYDGKALRTFLATRNDDEGSSCCQSFVQAAVSGPGQSVIGSSLLSVEVSLLVLSQTDTPSTSRRTVIRSQQSASTKVFHKDGRSAIPQSSDTLVRYCIPFSRFHVSCKARTCICITPVQRRHCVALQKRARTQRMPAHSWQAMSALAGGALQPKKSVRKQADPAETLSPASKVIPAKFFQNQDFTENR